MMLKGSDKEDVESVHIKIVDIKRENYSVTKDQSKTVTWCFRQLRSIL
jgi:hypothetical protein